MLTERELDVLLRRARGESQAGIADALRVSQAAVSQFEKNARRKLVEAHELIELLGQEGLRVEEGPLGKKVTWGDRR